MRTLTLLGLAATSSGFSSSTVWRDSSRSQSHVLIEAVPDVVDIQVSGLEEVDNRPHLLRTAPRSARRMNQAFRYLYRHDDEEKGEELSSFEFLRRQVGFSPDQILEMNQTFPPLLELDVKRHLRPKLRFLKETLGASDSEIRTHVPPQYFGSRVEHTVAPRHAFLVYNDLPSGHKLIEDPTLWRDFFLACRKPKRFCALCNKWRRTYGAKKRDDIVVKELEAFDVMFQRGLMPAARNELRPWNNTWPMQYMNITAGEMITLLIKHGANPRERDVRGATLLHWAAGTGHLPGLQVLLEAFDESGVFTEALRDGSSLLHWAAAGANAREFGVGGHPDVCQWLLEQVEGDDRKRLVNQLTKDGNSVLMWAAWSGTLDVVKLLIRNRADPRIANRNGCTVAHWASSSGNLDMCQYLANTVGVDFKEPNYGGNTPLTHAVAFGHVEIVEWLRNEVCMEDDDSVAASLAKDFVHWTEGEDRRSQVLGLFEDYFGHGETSEEAHDGDDQLDPFQ